MAGKPVGTMYVELSLDATKYTKAQKEILAGAEKNSADINKVFKTVGTQSDQMYNAMRANIENALTAIKKSHLSSADEIRRAQESAAHKITAINKQQFGDQQSLIEKAKAHWVGLSVAVAAAGVAMNRAMVYMEQGAKALQQESSFKIVAEQSGVMADTMIENMKRLTKETIDDSDLMQKSVKLMLAGFDAGQIERFSAQAVTASRIAGVSVSEAFDQLGDSIANKTPKAMVRLGAVTRDQMKIVEAAVKAGADSMTLFELAMANLELKALQMKGTQDEATIAMQRFHTQVKETGEGIGKFLIRALQVAWGGFQDIAAGALYAYSAFLKFMAGLGEATGGNADMIARQRSDADAAAKKADEYAAKSKANISGRVEQEEKASAQEISNAQKTRDAMLAKLKAMGEAGKDASKIMQSLMDANKEAFQAAVGELDRWAMRQRDAGADESALVAGYYAERRAALDEYYEADRQAIQGSLLKAAAKTAALSALDQRYNKERSDLLTKEERDQLNYNSRHLDVMAKLYKAVDQFSRESIDAQTAQLRGRYLEDGRWASATADQRKLIEKALNAEILKMTAQLEIQKQQIIQAYLGAVEGPNAPRFRESYQAQLQAAADLLDAELRGTGILFDREAWIQAQLLEFDRQRLAEKASFYESIQGMEARALEFGLQAIELQRLADIKRFGDVQAANKKASDAEGKLAQDLFLKKSKYISEGFGDLSKAFYGVSKLYKQGSEDAKRWEKASEAMEIAQRAVAVVNAVAAIANQGLGDPYTAFARIAAMAAAMGALLGSIGESINGGGGGGADTPYKAQTYVQGQYVLGGGEETGSESISKSYDLLKDTYSMEYRELTRIWKEVKNLNNSISGLVTSIVRAGGGKMSLPSAWTGYQPGGAEGIWNDLSSGKIMGLQLPFADSINKIANTLTFGLSGWLTKTIGGFIGSIFGGGKTYSAAGGGLTLATTNVENLIGGGGRYGRSYQDVNVEKKGGWFHSDKSWTERHYAELDSDVQYMLSKVFQNMSLSLVELTKALGGDVQKALLYVFQGEDIDLKGLSNEELSKKLNQYFNNAVDTAADAIFGDLIRKYQKLDEGLMETATRLIMDKEIVLNILKMTNQFVVGVNTMAVIALTESLVDLAGGLDKLQESAGQYYSSFFSDTEKATLLNTQLSAAMGDLGMAMPKTKGEFRSYVEAQNLMTEEGRENYVTLLNMAEAMSQYFDLMEKTMQKAIDAQGKVVSELQGYVDKLRSAREGMRMEGGAYVRQQAAQGQLAFQAVLEAARGGDFSGIGKIDRSLSSMTAYAQSTGQFKTREEYQRNFYQTYNSIAELEGLAGTQLTVEQQTLKAMQDQLDVLKKIEVNTGPGRIGTDDKGYAISPEGQAKRAADEAAAAAQVRMVHPAQSQSAVAMPSVIGGGQNISIYSPGQIGFTNPNGNIGGRNYDPNMTWGDFSFGGAASGGSASAGWLMTGEHGPELQYYGGPSEVINNSKTRALIDNTDVVAEIKALREELQAIGYQVAKNTNRSAKIFDRWDIDGLPAERVLA